MVTSIVANRSEVFSLEDYMLNPPKHMEWVEGQLLEKNGMTLTHGRIQAKLASYWRNCMTDSGQGGEVYTDAPCRTNKQGRRPDVAYLTSELLAQFSEAAVLPQSFPLIAEIISPTDGAEEVFAKAKEYLQSGCQEIWLVFPKSQWVLAIAQQQQVLLSVGDVVSTQILQGFSMAVDELFA
jgi:Uma2 family endonuclease